MAELNAKSRSKIPKKDFGLPGKAKTASAKKESGNYPMEDKKHAVAAKGRAKQQLNKGNLTQSQYNTIVTKANKKLGQSGKK
jgi:hypothetical protein